MSWAALEKHAPALSLLLQASRAADKARGNPPRAHLTPAKRTRPYGGLVSSSANCIVALNLGVDCGEAWAVFCRDWPVARAVHGVFGVESEPVDSCSRVRFPEEISRLIRAFDNGELPELVGDHT